MLSIKEQSNYLAKVVRLKNVRKHSNADRLNCVSIDGNNVITGTGAIDGDVVVYFPLECQINCKFLAYSNSFADATLNNDTTVKGYFPDTGRVRATKLRSEKSEGYIVPIALVQEWLSTEGVSVELSDHVGSEFDHVGNVLICNKYKIVRRNMNPSGVQGKGTKKKKSESRLIQGQYSLSDDTNPFKKNAHTILPDTMISVSYKMHGCNFSMGKVLVKRRLTLVDKIARFFGAKIVESVYDLVYASRSVIKNGLFDRYNEYSKDVWGDIAYRYADSISDGISINGEIVGYTSAGAYIQKGYDYGQDQGTCDLYVYRIYYTSPAGKRFEFNQTQINEYCKLHGLKSVPVLYYGKAKDLFPEIPVDDNWNDHFTAKMVSEYTEKMCNMCTNKVPAEGVVVTQNSDNSFIPLKLKSFLFQQWETKQLDSGEVSIEDEA